MPGIFKLKPLLGFAALVALAHAAPAPLFGIHLGSGDESSETPSDVSQNTISTDLVRPAEFARVAYCSPGTVTNLSCGPPCDALGGNVKVLLTGGDNQEIPRCMSLLTSFPNPT